MRLTSLRRGDVNAKAFACVIPAENVIGVYTQSKIPYVGSAAISLKSPLAIAVLAGFCGGLVAGLSTKKKSDEE